MEKISADLLVFDLDGTLIDSKTDIVNAFNRVLTELSRPAMSDDEIERYIGVGVQNLIRRLFEQDGEERIQLAQTLFQDVYEEKLLVHTKVYEGVFEVLDWYAAKPKVILTNKRQRFAGPSVERLNLKRYFQAVYAREFFPTCKPDPEPLFEISKLFGVPLNRMAIIGDTEVDMRAGLSANVKTVAVLYGYGTAKELESLRPDRLVKSVSELKYCFR